MQSSSTMPYKLCWINAVNRFMRVWPHKICSTWKSQKSRTYFDCCPMWTTTMFRVNSRRRAYHRCWAMWIPFCWWEEFVLFSKFNFSHKFRSTQTVLADVMKYREQKTSLFVLPAHSQNDFEYLPWTAASGKNGKPCEKTKHSSFSMWANLCSVLWFRSTWHSAASNFDNAETWNQSNWWTRVASLQTTGRPGWFRFGWPKSVFGKHQGYG